LGTRFDIAVIGGGIHGAGVAQAGAAAGHSVLVLEQYQGLARGTSSRSSKLIHGGLRYLETGQFALVKECLRERAHLLRNAPQLVRLKPFHIPVYRDSRHRPATLAAGLTLYALLGGLGPASRFRVLSPREWGTLEGLRTQGLQTVYRYHDAQTDDAALTRAVMASALALGADLELGAAVESIALDRAGATVAYRKDGRLASCHCRVVINATGPWAQGLMARVTPAQSVPRTELVQGTHIVLDAERDTYLYVEAPRDRRPVFIMPWQGRTLVGTTERRFCGDPGAVSPHDEELGYLLEVYRHYLPGEAARGAERLLGAFAGCRVLPGSQQGPHARPRETLLMADRDRRPRLLTIYGGKLTAYRATAEKVIARVSPSLLARKPRADTRRLALAPAHDLEPQALL
jgi:glycerol-3-phosphate dehydrogenase